MASFDTAQVLDQTNESISEFTLNNDAIMEPKPFDNVNRVFESTIDITDSLTESGSSAKSKARLEAFIDNSFEGFVVEPKLTRALSHLKTLFNTISPPEENDIEELIPAHNFHIDLRHTRSMGPVSELPNVQSNALERAPYGSKRGHS